MFGKSGSGIETDKVNEYTNGFQLLAQGTSLGGAHMIIKEFENGGFIFNAASISFISDLYVDQRVNTLLKNLLEQ